MTSPKLNGSKTVSLRNKSKRHSPARSAINNHPLSIIFCPSNLVNIRNPSDLGTKLFKNSIAISTAGQISAKGFTQNEYCQLKLPKKEFLVDRIAINGSDHFNKAQFLETKLKTIKVLKSHKRLMPNGNSLGILLINGSSEQEEFIASYTSQLIENLPIIGGSAAGESKNNFIFQSEYNRPEEAILILLTTTRPFVVYKTHSYLPTERKMVITQADANSRIVSEIDGEPALKAYAKYVGLPIKSINQEVFAKHPLMLKVGDEYFLRSIAEANKNNSLKFFCAIDRGLVLTLGRPTLYYKSVEKCFNQVKDELGPISFNLVFECFLRNKVRQALSINQQRKVENLYRENKCIGFHTYGEQYNGAHINQTLTGVAFGYPRKKAA